jgi:phosphoglycerol transferase MdoB-like AlkP superfamily enzyme
MFESYTGESDKEKTYRYSDFSLKQFFKKASSETWFNNTVFIITADHTLFTSRTGFNTSFHIPLLIYSPSLIAPGKSDKVASHIDILPTILDILNVPAIHSSMGFSVLDSTKNRYAFMKYGSYFGMISKDYVLLDDLENSSRIYNYYSDPLFKKDLSDRISEIKEEMKKKLYAYIQQVTISIGENKVYK